MGRRNPRDLAKAHGSKTGQGCPMKKKWVEDAQEKQMDWGCPKWWDGPRKPRSNRMGQGSPK